MLVGQFCSNWYHTITIRRCINGRKIWAEGSILQELCHFVSYMLDVCHCTNSAYFEKLFLEFSGYPFNTLQLMKNILNNFTRPSLRAKKWSGENKIECRRHERGRAREVLPPSRKGCSGDLPRENFDLLF